MGAVLDLYPDISAGDQFSDDILIIAFTEVVLIKCWFTDSCLGWGRALLLECESAEDLY